MPCLLTAASHRRSQRAAVQPVLVVHSTRDRLFPAAMAEQLVGWCGARARLRIVEGLHHNEPFHKPTAAYSGLIAEFLIEDDGNVCGAGSV